MLLRLEKEYRAYNPDDLEDPNRVIKKINIMSPKEAFSKGLKEVIDEDGNTRYLKEKEVLDDKIIYIDEEGVEHIVYPKKDK